MTYYGESLDEVGAGIADAHEKVRESLGPLTRAADQIAEAYVQLHIASQGTTDIELKGSIRSLRSAHSAVREIMSAYYPAISATMGDISMRLGVQPLHPLEAQQPEPLPTVLAETAPVYSAIPAEKRTLYWQQIQDLDDALYDNEDPLSLPNYVDMGSLRYVYSMPDDPDMLVKLPRTPDAHDWSARDTEEWVRVLKRGLGADGLEQLVTYWPGGDYFPGAVMVRRAPGQSLVDMTPEQLDAIPYEHCLKLIRNLDGAAQRDIYPDMFRSNTFYDRQEGFTIIDYLEVMRDEGEPTVDNYARHLLSVRCLLADWQIGEPFPIVARQVFKAFRAEYGKTRTSFLIHSVFEDLGKGQSGRLQPGLADELPDDL